MRSISGLKLGGAAEARQYPGAREFVESSNKESPGAAPNAYGACQVLVEAVKRAGSLDGAKVREAISRMDHNTVFGRFRVDQDGVQIGHRMLDVVVPGSAEATSDVWLFS